jgi:hypothetical protein
MVFEGVGYLKAIMTETSQEQRCPGCAERDRRLAVLDERVTQLKAALAQSQKNSPNSSRPSTNDVRPKPKIDKP